MPISPQSAKAKGRRLQQWVQGLILSLYKMLEPDDCVSRPMGSNGMDIMLSPAAQKAFPYAVECKSLHNIAVYNYYRQAQSNAGKLLPLVILKEDRSAPLALVDAEHFLWLTREAYARKEK